MANVSITGETWTKISDVTADLVLIQPQQPTSFQFSFGEPSAGEGTFTCKDGFLELKEGTLGEELWVYFQTDTVVVTWGVV